MKQQRELTMKEKAEKMAVDNQDIITAVVVTVVGTVVGNLTTTAFNIGKNKVSALMKEKGFSISKKEKPKKKTSEKLDIEGGEE